MFQIELFLFSAANTNTSLEDCSGASTSGVSRAVYFDPETLRNGDVDFDSRTLAGVPVTPHVRKSGKYLIGPKLGISPVKSIVQCLGRLEGTNKYYQVRQFKVSFETYYLLRD